MQYTPKLKGPMLQPYINDLEKLTPEKKEEFYSKVRNVINDNSDFTIQDFSPNGPIVEHLEFTSYYGNSFGKSIPPYHLSELLYYLTNDTNSEFNKYNQYVL